MRGYIFEFRLLIMYYPFVHIGKPRQGFIKKRTEMAPDQFSDMTPQGRAALITYLLMLRGEMTIGQIAESVELGSGSAVRAMMANLSSANVPVYQPERGSWAINRDEMARSFGQTQSNFF